MIGQIQLIIYLKTIISKYDKFLHLISNNTRERLATKISVVISRVLSHLLNINVASWKYFQIHANCLSQSLTAKRLNNFWSYIMQRKKVNIIIRPIPLAISLVPCGGMGRYLLFRVVCLSVCLCPCVFILLWCVLVTFIFTNIKKKKKKKI